MNEINGIYAATLSILDKNLSLDINKTINHADDLLNNGCHGVVFLGSTGQAQLISISEKINLINELSKCLIKRKYNFPKNSYHEKYLSFISNHSFL